ncbi:hypothetical protein DFH29DRAFT_858668 [Suillus ampliporus]|nr:hypothetical protein DFH29DRAFT_858668 [Suillus ampliporus]
MDSLFSGESWGSYLEYLIYPFFNLMGMGETISPRAVHSRRVPSLGGYGHYHGKITLLIGCFSGMVFGGIHCLGWNYLFQRHAEQMAWRAASLGVTCAPLCVFIGFAIGLLLKRIAIPSPLEEILEYFLTSTGVLSALIYIPARVTVVVLMMLSLRALPPGVYDTVAWTKFVPHL